jgi:hypothetical protein
MKGQQRPQGKHSSLRELPARNSYVMLPSMPATQGRATAEAATMATLKERGTGLMIRLSVLLRAYVEAHRGEFRPR